MDRKTIEKNRRIHMKALCSKLVSSIPPTGTDHQNHSPKKDIDLIDHAANYIQELRKRIDELKRKKDLLTATALRCTIYNMDIHCGDQDTITSNDSLNLPILQVRDLDSSTSLEVVLITEMNTDLMYYQLITLLEEEGAQVVNASCAIVNDKIFYTLHSQVRDGVEISRICARLMKLVY